MDFGSWTSLIRFLLLCKAVKSAFIPDGVHHTECRDRYFMIAVDLSFTGQRPSFEALDGTGKFPITGQYAAQCGYTVNILTVPGIVELRASYFSCHTTNQNDQDFTFNFNLIATRDDESMSYAVNKTCSPSLPWSPREVTCEINYLEVSVKNDGLCSLGPRPDSWDSSMQMVYSSAIPDWQVILVKEGEEMKPLNFSEANLKGYTLTETQGRLVFRTSYGQTHSSRTLIAGILVEVAHVLLFSRREWVVLLLDLVASCPLDKVAYDGDGGFVTWETPVTLYPALHVTNFSLGLNGELWETSAAQAKGYSVLSDNSTVKVRIPVKADGAYRKSVMTGGLADVFTYHLYVEQIAKSDERTETRSRTFRTLTSPPLKRVLLTEHRTAPEEDMFMVYLGNVPGDLELVALQLNDKTFEAPFGNSTSYTLDIELSPNQTYSYTLKVPFDDPLVIQQFAAEKAATENILNVVYTVMIKPESGPYSYHITAVALTEIAPPQFDVSCSESGITFKLDHEPSNVLWDFTVGSHRLTPELAEKQGYVLHNNSRTLELEVPLFAYGYRYEDITLEGFLGTFETLVRDRKTNEVQGSSVKTCPFTANEIVVCSKEGQMTVVAELSEAVARGGSPAETSLLDEFCSPEEADHTRALFSFSLNSCGTTVKLGKTSVTYFNEIRYRTNSTDIGSIPIQCTYRLAALHPLFQLFKFESETVGVGQIVRAPPLVTPTELGSLVTNSTTTPVTSTTQPTTTTESVIRTTTEPVTNPGTTVTKRPVTKPIKHLVTRPARKQTPRPPHRVTNTWNPIVYRRPAKYYRVHSASNSIISTEIKR